MKLKELATLNIEDTKVGRAIIIAVGLLITGLIIADQFSVENKCRREVTGLMNQLPAEFRSHPSVVETVIDSEVRDCVEKAKKQ